MHPDEAPDNGWQFNGEDDEANFEAPSRPSSPVTWTASEFIAHQKSATWYIRFGVAMAIAVVAFCVLTKDYIATAMIALVSIGFGVFAARKPRVLTYSLDDTGLRIGAKVFPYEQFKSFTVMQGGPINSISFLPLKRFMPGLTIYYPPEDEDKIVDSLDFYLPHEVRKLDAIDQLMQRIRF